MAIQKFADGSTLDTSTGKTTKANTTKTVIPSGSYITNSAGQVISPSDPNYKIYSKQPTSKPVSSSIMNNPLSTVSQVINNPTPKTEIKNPAFTELNIDPLTPKTTTEPVSNLSSLQQEYLKSLLPTDEENALKKQLNTLNTSTELGVQGMNAQGRGIPLGLIRGQQSRLQQQAGIQSNSLQSQIALEQANRIAKQNSLNAQVGFETEKEMQDRQYTEARAAEDRQYQRQQEAEKQTVIAAQNEFIQTMQKFKYRKLSPSEYKELVGQLGVTNKNFTDYMTKILNPVTGIDDIYLNPETSEKLDAFILSEGQARYDGNGNMVAYNPKDNKPDTQTIDGELYQYNPETQQWGAAPISGQEGMSKADEGKLQTVQSKIDLVDSIITSPYLKQVVGLKNPLTYWTPGSNEQLVKNQLEQLKQSLSLENRQQLKGSGAISDYEAKMLEKASTSLGSNLSNEDAVRILNDVKKVFETAKLKLVGPEEETGLTDEEFNLLKAEFPDLTEDEIRAAAFSKVGGDTNKATMNKVSSIKNGVSGGQCGAFVNKLTGLGLGDSYASKMSKMNPNIKVAKPGMIFTMPYKSTGHSGVIVGFNGNNAIVKDSNWNLDEKVTTHEIPLNKITGLANV